MEFVNPYAGKSESPANALPYDGPPTGTAREILDWVAKDRERAAQALANEARREHPRRSLGLELEKIINA